MSKADADVYWLEGWTGKRWQVLRELHPEGETQVQRDLDAVRAGKGAIPGPYGSAMRVRVERTLWLERVSRPAKRKPGKAMTKNGGRNAAQG